MVFRLLIFAVSYVFLGGSLCVAIYFAVWKPLLFPLFLKHEKQLKAKKRAEVLESGRETCFICLEEVDCERDLYTKQGWFHEKCWKILESGEKFKGELE